MGLIQAASGAIGGMLADQWKDFYTIPAGLPGTAAVFAAVPQGTNAGRGSNTKSSSNIISNGSVEDFAKAIGADAYCRDAAVAVETAKSYMAKKHNQLTAN